ncbi:MAG: cyclic pyranopterin monophosphate synthase MoaC [Euryarchaeota archaeon]|nr:cyclic pyranopterin monophosphate synthase MoaC [Euryarchaeota archaeon]|tara:strand:+ start:2188 stop:2637 length:450 start_codon:yes stop_codon:yes gene_type:complete
MPNNPSVTDIGSKKPIFRRAIATGVLAVPPQVLEIVKRGSTTKGDLKTSSTIAAIMAVKNTHTSLPHCHPIPIDSCTVDWENEDTGLRCTVTVSATAKTGVEMEALCGVSAGLLCALDMLKPILKDSDGQYPGTSIEGIRVLSKHKDPA